MTEVATKHIDSGDWLETLASRFDESGKSQVARACSAASERYGDRLHASGERMIGTSAHARGPRVRMVVTIEVDSLEQVERLTTLLAEVEGVMGARRRRLNAEIFDVSAFSDRIRGSVGA